MQKKKNSTKPRVNLYRAKIPTFTKWSNGGTERKRLIYNNKTLSNLSIISTLHHRSFPTTNAIPDENVTVLKCKFGGRQPRIWPKNLEVDWYACIGYVETVDHIMNIINKCSKLEPKKYKSKCDWVGKMIYWELCKKLKFGYADKYCPRKWDP